MTDRLLALVLVPAWCAWATAFVLTVATHALLDLLRRRPRRSP